MTGMPTYTSNTSFVKMHAKDVLRLATASILEIEELRRRAVNRAVEEALDAECTHFFGLIRHKQFRDRDDALKTCLEVRLAKRTAEGAMDTCQLLKKLSTMLLDDDKLTDDQRVIHLTLNDFRAIS